MRAILCVLAISVALSGCKKKRPSYDRSTPTKTLAALEKAFEKGRIPADLEAFFVNHKDISGWKLRCKNGACKKARFKVVKPMAEDEYSATYLVDVTVFGRGHQERVMQSSKTPVKFVFEDGAWFIEELGTYTRIPLKKIKPGANEAPKPGADAGG